MSFIENSISHSHANSLPPLVFFCIFADPTGRNVWELVPSPFSQQHWAHKDVMDVPEYLQTVTEYMHRILNGATCYILNSSALQRHVSVKSNAD
jgi:hypothetical protein